MRILQSYTMELKKTVTDNFAQTCQHSNVCKFEFRPPYKQKKKKKSQLNRGRKEDATPKGNSLPTNFIILNPKPQRETKGGGVPGQKTTNPQHLNVHEGNEPAWGKEKCLLVTCAAVRVPWPVCLYLSLMSPPPFPT